MFEEDQEIRELREKWPQMTEKEKLDKFLWKLVWFHHTKHVPGNPNQAINDLADKISHASDTSEKLTKSIRNATWVAAIVGGLGVLVAIFNLLRHLF